MYNTERNKNEFVIQIARLMPAKNLTTQLSNTAQMQSNRTAYAFLCSHFGMAMLALFVRRTVASPICPFRRKCLCTFRLKLTEACCKCAVSSRQIGLSSAKWLSSHKFASCLYHIVFVFSVQLAGNRLRSGLDERRRPTHHNDGCVGPSVYVGCSAGSHHQHLSRSQSGLSQHVVTIE